MTKQIKHVRTSKNGKQFVAGHMIKKIPIVHSGKYPEVQWKEQNISSIRNRTSGMGMDLNDIEDENDELDNVADDVEDVRSQLDDVNTRITSEVDKIEDIRFQLDDVNTRITSEVDKIEDTRSQLDDVLRDVQSSRKTITNRVGGLKSDLDKLK